MELTVTYRGRRHEVPSAVINRYADRLSKINQEKLQQIAQMETRKYLTRVSDELHRRHSGPWPGGTTNETLSKRSGAGLRSVKNFRVVKDGAGVVGQMRLNRYMAFHEHGGYIRAKNAQFLTIPLPAALDARGVPLRRSAREWTSAFIIRSRRNNLLIVHKLPNGDLEPLYVLKRVVRIRARLGMRDTLRREAPTYRQNIIEEIRHLMREK